MAKTTIPVNASVRARAHSRAIDTPASHQLAGPPPAAPDESAAIKAKIDVLTDAEARLLAVQRHCPTEALGLLADHRDHRVQAGVAGNTRTPAVVLDRLADPRRHRDVRWTVASMSSAEENTFTKLARDPDMSVRCALIENPHVGLAPLQIVAGSPSSLVRRDARHAIDMRELAD